MEGSITALFHVKNRD